MLDLYHNLKVTQVTKPQTGTTTLLSAAVDTASYDSVGFVFHLGTNGDTWSSSIKIEAEVQESSDNNTYTPVVDADLFKSVTGGTAVGTFAKITASTQKETDYWTGYRGKLRYLKVNLRFTGTHSNGSIVGVSAVLSNKKKFPATA